MSRQAATLVALAALATAGAALSAGAWLLLWRQVRRQRSKPDLTPDNPSSRNDQTEEGQ